MYPPFSITSYVIELIERYCGFGRARVMNRAGAPTQSAGDYAEQSSQLLLERAFRADQRSANMEERSIGSSSAMSPNPTCNWPCSPR